MTVILVDPGRPAMVPVEAVELLHGDVQYTEEIPIRVPWSLPSARPALVGPRRPGAALVGPRAPGGAGQTRRRRAGDHRSGAPGRASG